MMEWNKLVNNIWEESCEDSKDKKQHKEDNGKIWKIHKVVRDLRKKGLWRFRRITFDDEDGYEDVDKEEEDELLKEY